MLCSPLLQHQSKLPSAGEPFFLPLLLLHTFHQFTHLTTSSNGEHNGGNPNGRENNQNKKLNEKTEKNPTEIKNTRIKSPPPPVLSSPTLPPPPPWERR
uniref:Uncharacterized protein n=1 Tax=Oryza brachyantha TaxID=4533 RepID=J3MF75_ORYBR